MKIPFPIYLIRIGKEKKHGPIIQNMRPSFFLKATQALLASQFQSEAKLIDLRFQTFPYQSLMKSKSIFIIDSDQFHINETCDLFNSTLKFNQQNYYFFIGQGPTAVPNEYLKISSQSKNSFVIKGEPEEVLLDCLSELASHADISLRASVELQANLTKNQIAKNYHNFPPTYFTKEELDNYQYIFPLKIKEQIYWGHLLATRGCPHTCSFCTNLIRESYGTNFRTKKTATIIEEINHLKSLGVNAIAFGDDDLTADQDYLNEFCDELIRLKIDIQWTAHARIDECTPDLIKKMKLAGCSLLRFGLESGSEKILRYYNKTRRPELWKEQVKTITKACRENNIQTIGLFIIGSPNEYWIDIMSTVRLIFANPFSLIQLHIFTPFQDTIESKKLKVKDIVQTSYYNPNAGNFSPLGKNKIKIIFCLIYFCFYLNPLQISKTMKDYGLFFLHNNDKLKTLVKSFLSIFTQTFDMKTNENKSLSST